MEVVSLRSGNAFGRISTYWYTVPGGGFDWNVGQSPKAPCVGAAMDMHGLAIHVAAVVTPAEQDVGPDTVYPGSHFGWHVEPHARVPVQVPIAPFVGAVIEVQSGRHVAAVVAPSEQVVAPDTV